MKMMKKTMAMLLAVLMLFVMSIPAMAAEADLSNHSYVTYQIFTGSQAPDNAELAQIAWGSGINGPAFLNALKASTAFGGAFANCADAKDVAAVVSGWADDSAEAKTFAKVAYANRSGISGGTTNLGAGYYLVVDTTTFGAGAVNTVYNLALLQLTQKGSFEIRNKVSVPEVYKKVIDKNDTTGVESDWQDSADHDIGDNVKFRLTATLASIADYDTYKVVFHDDLSAGLTFNNDAVILIDGRPITLLGAYTVRYVGTDLTVTINDVKACGARDNSVITVDYTARLNENAVIGAAGNPNTVYLEYSNNPNESGAGNNYTGRTPEDKVIVFTYKVIIDKVDQNGRPLTGATFELEKLVGGQYVSLGIKPGDNASTFEWVGIDDGDYRLTEIDAPKGYNKVDPVLFTVSADHEVESADPKLISLNGGNALTGDVNPGTLTGKVENQPGVTLPETGGIGTTIFYVMGAILLLGATVLLIARKRMQSAE